MKTLLCLLALLMLPCDADAFGGHRRRKARRARRRGHRHALVVPAPATPSLHSMKKVP